MRKEIMTHNLHNSSAYLLQKIPYMKAPPDDLTQNSELYI